MIRLIVAMCLLYAAGPVAPVESKTVAGAWNAYVSEKHPEKLHLSLRVERNGQNGSQFDRSAFSGLTSEQIGSATQVPVKFEMRREAGTVAFEGTFRDGHGAGEFTFVPDREFPEMLGSLGVELASNRQDRDQELFYLALYDVSSAFIHSMQKIGYRVPLAKYQEFRIFGVDPAYVREMAAAGFDKLSADKLVETRIHGATPDYIWQMRAAGNDLTLDGYIQSRIFQITPEFADDMSRVGYPDLDHDTLVQFRIHGVSPEFVHQLRDVGYSQLPAEQLVQMRIHGVTPEFIRRVAAAGYHRVPVEKLVQMRIFNIEPEMVKALDEAAR